MFDQRQIEDQSQILDPSQTHARHHRKTASLSHTKGKKERKKKREREGNHRLFGRGPDAADGENVSDGTVFVIAHGVKELRGERNFLDVPPQFLAPRTMQAEGQDDGRRDSVRGGGRRRDEEGRVTQGWRDTMVSGSRV
eukprot:624563-Rhodomonas_salina.2